MKNIHKFNENIYITSDEEIKEGDYWVYICPINGLDYGDNNNPIVKNNLPPTWFEKLHDKGNYKKIIITTDQDLIKDGIQAIDDDFLEWFVNNPSCESVEVRKETYAEYKKNSYNDSYLYEIIIPKEEPKQEPCDNCNNEVCCCIIKKQETIETAFESFMNKNFSGQLTIGLVLAAMKFGVYWQQDKNKYSEEDMMFAYKQGARLALMYVIGLNKGEFPTPEEWFEQFKNK